MSGQGLTTKRLTSARDGFKMTDSKESVGSGRFKKKIEAGKLSSTHSLQINMPRQVKGKDSDDASNQTNRLEESVYIDERGVKMIVD